MDPTPPATTTSAVPASIMCEAMVVADGPEVRSRFAVMPGTVSGKPASSHAVRATLRFSSPAPLALPTITSSTSAPAPSKGAVVPAAE